MVSCFEDTLGARLEKEELIFFSCCSYYFVGEGSRWRRRIELGLEA